MESGATLRADSTGAGNGGMLAMLARNSSTGIVWAINPDAEVATVNIDNANVVGGSVIISAVANAVNALVTWMKRLRRHRSKKWKPPPRKPNLISCLTTS